MTEHQPKLTEPEIQLLKMVGAGVGNRVIAQELRKSEYTVRNQLSRLYKKIDVGNRVQAATWFRAYAVPIQSPQAVEAESEFVERRQSAFHDRRVAAQLHPGLTDTPDGKQRIK